MPITKNKINELNYAVKKAWQFLRSFKAYKKDYGIQQNLISARKQFELEEFKANMTIDYGFYPLYDPRETAVPQLFNLFFKRKFAEINSEAVYIDEDLSIELLISKKRAQLPKHILFHINPLASEWDIKEGVLKYLTEIKKLYGLKVLRPRYGDTFMVYKMSILERKLGLKGNKLERRLFPEHFDKNETKGKHLPHARARAMRLRKKSSK